jgi:DNA-directed RNA polymerase alpha subunit
MLTGPKRRRRRKKPDVEETTAFLHGRRVPLVSLSDIPLMDVRTLNELGEHDIIYAHQLAACTREDVGKFSNFGAKATQICRDALVSAGFGKPEW